MLSMLWRLVGWCQGSRELGISEIPPECLCKILALLPMKEIIRNRVVCKAWNRLIKREEMWKGIGIGQETWVLLGRTHYCHQLCLRDYLYDDVWCSSGSFVFDIPRDAINQGMTNYEVVATDQGLVCGFLVDTEQYFVRNPITKCWKLLPKLDDPTLRSEFGNMFVDPITGHYRIFIYREVGVNGFQFYDSISESWTSGTFLPVSRLNLSHKEDVPTYAVKNLFESGKSNFVAVYDPLSGTYCMVRDIEFPRDAASMQPFVKNYKGRLILVSTINCHVPRGHLGLGVWEFDTQCNKWKPLSQLSYTNILHSYEFRELKFLKSEGELLWSPLFYSDRNIIVVHEANHILPVILFDIDKNEWKTIGCHGSCSSINVFTPNLFSKP